MALYIKYREKNTETPENLPKYDRTTQDLYKGVTVERDQKGLTRGRFVKFEGDYLYLEYYYKFSDNKDVAPEAIKVPATAVYNCEERYFTTSDGTKIDKLNAMTDTSEYNGQQLSGGLGVNWFEKNVKVG
jgi:hypothetical protein